MSETPFFQPQTKPAGAHRALIIGTAPLSIGAVDVSPCRVRIGRKDTMIAKKVGEHVHLDAICAGGGGDVGGGDESGLLPFEASGDEPVEDARRFGPQPIFSRCPSTSSMGITIRVRSSRLSMSHLMSV